MNVSISNDTFDRIVEKSRPKKMNRSEWVETLIIRGYDSVRREK